MAVRKYKHKLKKYMKKDIFTLNRIYLWCATDFVLINIASFAICIVFKRKYSSETEIENIKILESHISGNSLETPDNTEIINVEIIKAGKQFKDRSTFG